MRAAFRSDLGYEEKSATIGRWSLSHSPKSLNGGNERRERLTDR